MDLLEASFMYEGGPQLLYASGGRTGISMRSVYDLPFLDDEEKKSSWGAMRLGCSVAGPGKQVRSSPMITIS